MYAVRKWSVSHAKGLNGFYKMFEGVLLRLHPLFKAIGYDRLEAPVAAVEQGVKGILFDCQMCGQCALSSTGMSCPMNCPKSIRNGPCGGVRPNGMCEVKPEMRCVWVEAWRGAGSMGTDPIMEVQPAIDQSLKGKSSWLRVARDKNAPEGDAT